MGVFSEAKPLSDHRRRRLAPRGKIAPRFKGTRVDEVMGRPGRRCRKIVVRTQPKRSQLVPQPWCEMHGAADSYYDEIVAAPEIRMPRHRAASRRESRASTSSTTSGSRPQPKRASCTRPAATPDRRVPARPHRYVVFDLSARVPTLYSWCACRRRLVTGHSYIVLRSAGPNGATVG